MMTIAYLLAMLALIGNLGVFVIAGTLGPNYPRWAVLLSVMIMLLNVMAAFVNAIALYVIF